jgi:hypothetical protein
MEREMGGFIREKHKVFNAVVCPNFVDMMYNFFLFKKPSNVFFHHKSMLKNFSSLLLIGMFGRAYKIISLGVERMIFSVRNGKVLFVRFRKLFSLPRVISYHPKAYIFFMRFCKFSATASVSRWTFGKASSGAENLLFSVCPKDMITRLTDCFSHKVRIAQGG